VYLLQNDLDRTENSLAIVLARTPKHVAGRNILRDLRFRQGKRLSEQGKFSQADHAYHEAAALPGGKELWRWQSLGFCPAVFPDEYSICRYWAGLHQHLDRAIDANIPFDWRSLPEDGFTPSFNLPHLDTCCREVKEKFDRLFSRAFPFQRPTLIETQKNRKKIRVGFVVTAGHHRGFLRVHRHLLEHLDHHKFEVFIICPEPIIADCRKSVRRDAIQWVGFSPRFDVAVQTLFDTRCDILYHWKKSAVRLIIFSQWQERHRFNALPMAPTEPAAFGRLITTFHRQYLNRQNQHRNIRNDMFYSILTQRPTNTIRHKSPLHEKS
jgi:hypothetical protein